MYLRHTFINWRPKSPELGSLLSWPLQPAFPGCGRNVGYLCLFAGTGARLDVTVCHRSGKSPTAANGFGMEPCPEFKIDGLLVHTSLVEKRDSFLLVTRCSSPGGQQGFRTPPSQRPSPQTREVTVFSLLYKSGNWRRGWLPKRHTAHRVTGPG